MIKVRGRWTPNRGPRVLRQGVLSTNYYESISQIRACWSFSIPVKTFAWQNLPRVHADKFQLRGSPITSIHRFFLFFSSTSNPTGPLPLPFQQEESSKHRSQPEALYGRAFFLFFFFFYDRPGSFRKRALTVEPRGGCKVSDAFPRDNFDIMKYRRGSSIKLD